MIRGIGNDIIEIRRIESAIERYGQRFLERIFTSKELEYCARYRYPMPQYAGRFAAKEAIAKALGTGFKGVSWLDIEVENDPEGKPVVRLSESLRERFANPNIMVSISHSEDYATAIAIWT